MLCCSMLFYVYGTLMAPILSESGTAEPGTKTIKGIIFHQKGREG
jgi:hypothetical protein